MSLAPGGQPLPSPGGLLATRRESAPSKRDQRRALWRMLRLVYPHRRAMAWGLLLGFGVAATYATSLIGILPVLKIVVERQPIAVWLQDKAARHPGWWSGTLQSIAGWFPSVDTPEARMRSLLIVLGALLLLNLFGNLMRCLSQYLVLYASNRAAMDLRRIMYRKALRLPLLSVAANVSTTVSQFMSDVRELYLGIVTLFGKIAREPLKAACVLAAAIAMDWRLTLVVLAIAPVAVGLLWFFGRRVRKAAVKLLEGYGVMLGSLDETLQGVAVVKGFAREGHERRRMWKLERRMLRQQNRLAWVEAVSSPIIEVIGLAVAAAGVVWLASRTFSNPAEFPPDRFITMVVLLSAMLDPVRKVANVYNVVQRAGAAAHRIFTFLDGPEERSPRPAQPLPPGAPRVRFENVSFRYQPGAPPALRNVTFEVEPGACIAIVGPNGSGKSTLLRLVPRFLDPQSGAVLLSGIDVRALELRALRERIAIVSQTPVVFARSVRENIAYGRPDATDDEIRAAARQAYAAEFIESLPQRFDTVLGEYGASISGGQRQRIAIARAFLKRASLLIFDEATSEVDADSERKIHAALAELRRGKTTFLIAHRHTVMDMADRIVVMDEGAVVDSGARDELLARCPLFQALYAAREPAEPLRA